MPTEVNNTFVQAMRTIHAKLVNGEPDFRISCASKKEAMRLRFQFNAARRLYRDESNLKFLSISVEDTDLVFRPQISTQAMNSIYELIAASPPASPTAAEPGQADDADQAFKALIS